MKYKCIAFFNKLELIKLRIMTFYNLIRSLSGICKKRSRSDQNVIKHQIATKNKWLYPNDNFGKMEKGVVK